MPAPDDVAEVADPGFDHGGRRDRLRSELAGVDVAAILVTHPPSVRWLTGFTGSNGQALVATERGHDRLFTDGRYAEQAAAQAPGLHVDLEPPVGAARVAQELGGRLGVEARHTTWDLVRRLERPEDDEGRAEVVALEDLTGRLRAAKDPEEIALIRQACRITCEAFEDLLTWVQPGMTERSVALRLERTMEDLGAQGRAFESIVASGPNSARPHHRPTGRAIRSGELLKLDFGAKHAGYHSDMTRTIAIGAPDPELAEIHAIVRRAQQAGVEAVAPEVPVSDVDAACRGPITEAGHGDHFVHSTGHGVGLEIHEHPLLAKTRSDSLQPRYVVTVEPGIYLPGRGGVRIEDTIVVTPTGAERLTTAPHDLLTV